MPAYSGKFTWTDPAGAVANQGPCRVAFDEESCTVTSASGAPVAFDLGDVDDFIPGSYELHLVLYTGARVTLHYFGKVLDDMTAELREAWRNRLVKCLLLEDLKECGRYSGMGGEVRIYQSNLAVLPDNGGAALQWRLADVDSITFDPDQYAVVVEGGGRRLILRKLAKKTDEVLEKLRAAREGVRRRSAETLRGLFPFLDEGRIGRLLTAMPEGHSVPLEPLAVIHPKLPGAFVERAVDQDLLPYFDALRARGGEMMAGFKLLRDSEEDEEFFWFFFRLRRSLAWEATTGSGRATYFFKPGDIAELTRGLALINFRRQPIYMSDDALPYKYVVGARRLPELRALRGAFLGRAIHSSVEEWTAQVESVEGRL
jgi:hypothetical protein